MAENHLSSENVHGAEDQQETEEKLRRIVELQATISERLGQVPNALEKAQSDKVGLVLKMLLSIDKVIKDSGL